MVDELEPGATYISIHDVPYKVVAIINQTVRARCEQGRNKDFDIDRISFMRAMKTRIDR